MYTLLFPLLWLLAEGSPGSYLVMSPQTPAAGQLSGYTRFVLAPPRDWGTTTFLVNGVVAGTSPIFTNAEFGADKVVIEYVGLYTDITNTVVSKGTWTPFNQYVTPTWKSLRPSCKAPTPAVPNPLCLRPDIVQAPFPPTTLDVFNYGEVTSSPPCSFAASVAAGGGKLTLWVLFCAASGFTADDEAQFMIDTLTVFLPGAYTTTNPAYPQVSVMTQATYFFWNGAGFDAPVGPTRVVVPWVTTAPELALSALQFLEFYPGAPSRSIPINTVADQSIEAMTVTLQLGVQLQAGNTLAIMVSTVPLIDIRPTFLGNPALLSPLPNVIWADPAAPDPTTPTFIPLGPSCARGGATVNCCSQSVGTIQKPIPGLFSLAAWWTTMAITLGPAGCVLPADRRFSFVIPKAYLGKNPPQANVLTQAGVRFPASPGFQALDVRVLTSAETYPASLARFSETDLIAYRGIAAYGEAPGLDIVMPYQDFALTLGSSSYVVGVSTVAALQVTIDTTIAAVQPQKMGVTVTLRTGLPALPGVVAVPPTSTWYWVVLTANQGVLRPNVGTLTTPLQLPGTQPSACTGVTALTTAKGTLMISIREAACITALGAANAVLAVALTEAFLYPNLAAGTVVTFDVRVIPAQGIANFPFEFNGAVVTVDSAALMNVQGYTTTVACQTMNYQAGSLGDIAAMSIAARCTLVDSMAQISPITAGFLQCNPGATVNNAQSLVTFVKIAEGSMSSAYWPGTTAATPALWPQNVALSGTPAVYLSNWGVMFSTPMFAVVVSYPPSLANLQALGVAPSIPSPWLVAFLVKMDRITTACSTPFEENPWSFCVATATNVVSVMYFSSNPVNRAGTPVETLTHSGWGKVTGAVCVTVVGDGAVAGFYTVAVSPNDDDSDGAWYAFFALFALPLLCLCCLALLALLFLKKKKQPCCNAMPMGMPEPVPEVYWVNTYPTAPQAAFQAPTMMLPPTPTYYVQ